MALSPASFRGVPFFVEFPLEAEGGRRLVRHEGPQRDGGELEDKGRSIQDTPVVGFVLGPGYEARRAQMFQAIQARGPGTLVHPSLGTMRVCCEKWGYHEEGGVARFTMHFVEAAQFEPGFPSTPVTSRLVAETSASAVAQFAANAAKLWKDVTKYPSRMLDQAGQVMDAADKVITVAEALLSPSLAYQVANLLARVHDTATTLIVTPRNLAQAWADAIGLIGQQSEAIAGSFLDLWSSSAAAASVPGLTPAEQALRDNAVTTYQQICLTALATAATQAAAATWTTYDDAMTATATLADQLAEAAGRVQDVQTFTALQDLRGSLVEHVAAQVVTLPRLMTYVPARVMSAMELAQELYQDGSRWEEIVTRNRIPHPGFLPLEPLKVLSW